MGVGFSKEEHLFPQISNWRILTCAGSAAQLVPAISNEAKSVTQFIRVQIIPSSRPLNLLLRS